MRRTNQPKPGTLVLRHALAATSLAVCALHSSAALAGGPTTGCVPVPEICDGIDNDCDGEVDNDNPGGATPCPTGLLGACAEGTLTCVHGAMMCLPEVLPGTVADKCDGIDNDCNGLVDDATDHGAICYAGTGACLREGWMVCDSAGGTLCNAVAAKPSPETCDGVDNDCDGLVDQGNPDGGYACNSGLEGVCAVGTALCTNGVMDCIADVVPGAQVEICDGRDNDCDGVIDDGDPDGGAACATGLSGPCGAGVERCTGGALRCEPLVLPGALIEVCGDHEDNDCDGLSDEGCGYAGGGGGPVIEGIGSGGGSADCDEDADCDEGSICESGVCAPAPVDDAPHSDLLAYGCACRSAPRDAPPLEGLLCAAAAASVLALRARARSNKRR